MPLVVALLTALLLIVTAPTAFAKMQRFGAKLCSSDSRFYCVKVRRGDSWESLFPDHRELDLMKRLNRMNIRLRPGMRLAIPEKLEFLSAMDLSPLHHQIPPPGRKVIVIALAALAWGAYAADGSLVMWGPVSGGKGYCSDVRGRCETVIGKFATFRKHGEDCYSTKFPVGKGGAPMPYCMFFKGGYALHGSPVVPGHHASHGCVRLFTEDAQWLNEQFIKVLGKQTFVIVLPYQKWPSNPSEYGI